MAIPNVMLISIRTEWPMQGKLRFYVAYTPPSRLIIIQFVMKPGEEM